MAVKTRCPMCWHYLCVRWQSRLAVQCGVIALELDGSDDPMFNLLTLSLYEQQARLCLQYHNSVVAHSINMYFITERNLPCNQQML